MEAPVVDVPASVEAHTADVAAAQPSQGKADGLAPKAGAVAGGVVGGLAGAAVAGPVGKIAGGFLGKRLARALFGGGKKPDEVKAAEEGR